MKRKNFKAGYISDSVAKIIDDFRLGLDLSQESHKNELHKINGLLEYVSSFDVEFPFDHSPDFNNLHPVLAVVNNIITRGLPARVPLSVEQVFNKIGLVKENKKPYSFNYVEIEDDYTFDYKHLFKLLHIIEPGLEINKANYGGDIGNISEWNFLNSDLRDFPFVKQILEPQRDFASINKTVAGHRTVDFSYASPYWREEVIDGVTQHVQNNRGFVIEVDGKHHQQFQYKVYDKYRDDAAAEEDYDTYRVTSLTVNNTLYKLNELFKKPSYAIYAENYYRELDLETLAAYTLLFTPLAVARIQKTLIEYFISDIEILNKDVLDIAIIERDLPCGAMAVEELTTMFNHLNNLLAKEENLKLPKINLIVFSEDKWLLHKQLHLDINLQDELFFDTNEFDIVIDNSVLRRSKIYNETTYTSKKEQTIKIRSSHFSDHSFGQKRRTYCSESLKYNSLVLKQEDGSYTVKKELESSVNYFIQTLFRKLAYRPGQLPIINRALQHQPVIGLLPTGGGKSLTYQLSAFMQPGVTIVVDPIKSLMEDQVRVLNENWIDNCSYINSSLDRPTSNSRLIDFKYGEAQLFFVSPERFVIQGFRNIVSAFNKSSFGLCFSYCVIDEVHCVSEWGHDFRVTYLMLGKNAQQFAKRMDETPASLIGLTATASFDVLADVERELNIQSDDLSDAIIAIDNTIRPELFFKIKDVTDKERIAELNKDFTSMGKNLQKLNQEEVLSQSLAQHYLEFENEPIGTRIGENSEYKYALNEKGLEIVSPKIERLKLAQNYNSISQNEIASVIFCRTKSKTDGVDFLFTELDSNSTSFYYGARDEDTDVEKNIVHQHFIDFTTGKKNHMVCTKAFGMGIDKDNIRTTYHYHYSSSLESTIQEAGRAGRDGKIAESTILYSQRKSYRVNISALFYDFKEVDTFTNRFNRKNLRKEFERYWDNDVSPKGAFVNVLFDTYKEYEAKVNGLMLPMINPTALNGIKEALLTKDEKGFLYLETYYEDRETLNFFHNKAHRGISIENCQILYLLKTKEFSVDGVMKRELPQHELENELKERIGYFNFSLANEKVFPDSGETICDKLSVEPDAITFGEKTNAERATSCLKYNNDFNDFLFLLEEDGLIPNGLNNLTKQQLINLELIYGRDRSATATGRLIYRMQAMGLLIDYTTDYNLGTHNLELYRADSIEYYQSKIEEYLGRYLSERATQDYLFKLKERLKGKEEFTDKIRECLSFLTEFSYKEIVHKRKVATDEIEQLLNTSLQLYPEDFLKQNLYFKEQVYFYFNAKYARIGFKINGNDYSLVEDYYNDIAKREILAKYLPIMVEEGTAQNNYKHMIGSCTKILRNLAQADLEQDWLLHLIKGFVQYAVNSTAYLDDARINVKTGLARLYSSDEFGEKKYDEINAIVQLFFTELEKQLQPENPSHEEIRLLRIDQLIILQSIGIDEFIMEYNQLEI